jgi:hypothetical protein
MILGFKPQFKQPILDGTKKHTIREDKHNRWHAGITMQMATGVRTKKYNCFQENTCKSVQRIDIIRTSDYLNETIVKVDGRVLSEKETQSLAWNDGFVNLIDFWLWFSDGLENGKIIHWTDFYY